MLENTTTVRAESVEKAIKIGLTRLDANQDEVTVNVISEGKKGLFGFGKQDAIVELTKKSDMTLSELTQQLEETQSTNSPDLGTQPQDSWQTQVDLEENEAIVEPAANDQFEIIKEERANQLVAEEENDSNHQETASEQETVAIQSQEEIDQSRTLVAQYLEAVINEYGAPGTVSYEESGNQVIFNIDSPKSGLVIGKHGRIINALQILAQVMLHQYDRRRLSVLINVGDYRDRRAGVLEQMAQRTAKQVLKTKQPVILDPLPSYERKQIHAYLSKVDHIKTHSEGKDPNRYLVVEYTAN
ncbi:RNA-binding cell elongation regulator Jag/EloR [Vaginisenegalia massiliensis]|uniref:RNA-binding cell elongation regulator Jag/EloR n=1 Tax=Vaginisenegalia massiliensis TaxID=2058294 RepID=UPI000F53841F|nr:RNA-binding cell elongation regulator Jag/EloR [Vaginisenegalia massiliensis]